MRRSYIYLSLLCLLCLTGILAAQSGSSHGSTKPVAQSRFTKGRAVFREMSFDFGKVPQDSRVSKKFYLVNEGADTLEIVEIRPG